MPTTHGLLGQMCAFLTEGNGPGLRQSAQTVVVRSMGCICGSGIPKEQSLEQIADMWVQECKGESLYHE